jgi:hypothetical protein
MDPGGHVNKLALAAILLAAPLAARADIGLRVGPEVALAYNDAKGTHAITDTWPVAVNVMLSYWMPTSLVALDLELSEQFRGSGPSSGRIGTVLRPGVRLNPPVLPIYLRGAIPINIETASGFSRETFDLRLGAGLTFPLVLFHIFLEGDVDFPLGGGTNPPSAFSSWQFLLSAGLDFRF